METPIDQSIVPVRHADRSMLRTWCVGLALTALAVAVSYAWLDRPLAFFVHDHVSDKHPFILLQRIPELFPPVSTLVLAWCAAYVLARRPFVPVQVMLLACSLSFIVAKAVNEQLKFAFGRTWPETWINNNPSLIGSGAYGFNPFHGGPGFASFPSGHTAAVCAVMAVLWIYYPRGRVLFAAIVAAVAVGLIGADYHFLSDIIAGGFLGVTAGWTISARLRARCCT